MENIEMNEIVTTEAMTDLVDEAVASGVSGVRTGVLIGGSMVLGALAYEKIAKPAVQWLGRKIAGVMEARKAKKAEAYDLDKMNVDISDVE